MSKHEAEVRQILSKVNTSGILVSRESTTVEFKESFNKNSTVDYARTMAAFSNFRGGYIIFGVKDNPRQIVGLKNDKFETFNQEQFTETINSIFAPAIEWECGTLTLDPRDNGTISEDVLSGKKLDIGWLFTGEADSKPIVAQKANDRANIVNGDIFYRYNARTEKIKSSELNRIIEVRLAKEREGLLRLIEVIRKNGTANLGIVNYEKGLISTPYGIDVALDRKLVTQVLRRAKFIKEGSFNETTGLPVIKVTGNIDLAEEVPVPDLNPDDSHPYIQKQLAEILGITPYRLYALIWYFKMKEAKKYCISITTSRSGSPTYKFSNFAVQFLREKWKELDGDPSALNEVINAYRARNSRGGGSGN